LQEWIEWLLNGPPWVEYRTRLDLLGQGCNDKGVIDVRSRMAADPQVNKLINVLMDWPGAVLNSHKSAGHPLHLFTFIADIGLTRDDPRVGNIIGRIMQYQDINGPFQVLMNISPGFGGSGEDQWGWALCDAPLVLSALVKMGLADDRRVLNGIDFLTGLVRENGWPCAVSPELGKFHGPGRKNDPCPFANLAMLRVLSEMPTGQGSQAAQTGVQTLLNLWQNRSEQHPYLFYMGTDFCKLKAPLVWFDLLHVCDVLTRFPWLRGDTRLEDMIGILKEKGDRTGKFVPESIWTAWKEWDFGQKREPSRWLTFLTQRVIHRMNML
jgi:hypothetical protein